MCVYSVLDRCNLYMYVYVYTYTYIFIYLYMYVYVYTYTYIQSHLKRLFWDFPGGAVVKIHPASAGDTGSSPSPGRSHMPQSNLSLCTTTTEPALQSPRATTTEAHAPRACALQQEKPPQLEARRTATESSPRSPQLEKAHAATKTQCSQK